MNSLDTLSKKSLAQYGVLALPLAFAGMPLYVHAPDFYATEQRVPLATIGIALLLLRCFDAVQDPIIGRLSDRGKAHRLSIITAGAILLVVSFALLFQPMAGGGLGWFIISMLLATTAFSIVSINLNALGGLWSNDTYQKTRITTMREAFGLCGLLLAVILPSVLMQHMPKMQAFLWVSITLLVLMVIAVLIFRHWYRSEPSSVYLEVTNGSSMLHIMQSIPLETRRFFIIYGVSMFASSLPALLVLFFIRDRLGAEEYTGLFLLLYFVAGMLGMPIWQRLSKSHGKGKAWMVAMLLAVVSFVWAFFLREGDIWQFATICVLSGIAFGADLALPPSILADHIQYHENEKDASIQFGVLTFLAKAALAVASFIGLSLLDIAQFRPAADNHPSALLMLSLLYALLPCVIKLFSVFLLYCSKDLFLSGGSYEKTKSNANHRSGDHAG